MVHNLIHSVPFVMGVSVVAIALGGRITLITGIVFIVLALFFR